jgi:sigma-B regulation protein RsbU (phosphoserine phosphatase)
MHYLWGMLVRLVRPTLSQATLYFYVSLGLSVFYFLFMEYVTFNELHPFFYAILIYLGYLFLRVGYNLLNQRMPITAVMVYAVLGLGAILVSLIFAEDAPGLAFGVPLSLLILCALYSVLKIVLRIVVRRNIYTTKRGLWVIGIMTVGIIAPLLLLLIGLRLDLGLPIQYYIVLTLTIPLVTGNGFLQYDVFSSRLFFGTGVTQFLFNAFLSVIGTAILLAIVSPGVPLDERAVPYALFGLIMLFLLLVKRLVQRKFQSALFMNRDEFASSLQNIAELVSVPEDISVKIERIIAEIVQLTDVRYVRLIFFDESSDEQYRDLGDHVEHLTEESPLYSFLTASRGLIFRHTLIQNSPLEESVFRFLEVRHTVLVIPIFKERHLISALLIGDKKTDRSLSRSEIKYLKTVSFQIQQLFENDQLLREYITRVNFEKELDIASDIQMRLLPKKAPPRRGLIIDYYNRPYLKVTGDYFDFITIDKNRTAVVVGDVSGHGLAAAMILSMISSITNAVLREKRPIDRAFLEINHFLNYRYQGSDLITLFIGIYNRKSREMTYINAGHLAPVIIRKGRMNISFLEGRSKILGADPAARYFVSRISLERGDQLFFYTDGAIEIYDERSTELFSEKNLLEIISKKIHRSSAEKIDAIVKSINTLDQDAINDDITLIGITIR